MNHSDLPQLITRLDQNLAALGGYGLRVLHYDFAPGDHRVEVQAYPETVESAQIVADALNVEFHQEARFPDSYIGHSGGVDYGFILNSDDTTGYPSSFTPTTVHA